MNPNILYSSSSQRPEAASLPYPSMDVYVRPYEVQPILSPDIPATFLTLALAHCYGFGALWWFEREQPP